ncbi:conserved hypothetical protein [Arcobacter nitrofigilis DSM 7299]|uniref:DUF177 domain-containing protein n=1 Tax=Arcobacter nitrofigilis (strain ATCC 33309 / DSM 7299 / CCUG 15893 / LMG 7604 / NCTC 12251 / CI) TaxID=572480 RepID=D5V6X7_ARCNC|nr:hypothetical protein [Arcobacter nitrofigilis]ADG94397.1 conserved hypothetical protein [Arcobacter nitrofigilis DSM 7299]
MQIEFRKVPFTAKEFNVELDSVKLEGTFCKMSPTLAKVEATLVGSTSVDCCRCGAEYTINLNENLEFLLSNRVYEDESELENLVIEIENDMIDFDEIIESEISSIRSDYHICALCLENKDSIEKEY